MPKRVPKAYDLKIKQIDVDLMLFDLNLILSGVPEKIITHDKIIEFIEDNGTKRINFATTHSNALKKNGDETGGVINLPFRETIEPITKNLLKIELFPAKFGVWRRIKTDEEYAQFNEFINEYRDIVFLRDLLDLSLALSMNYEGEQRTFLGELEFQAKFNNSQEAEKELTEICKDWIKEIPFLKGANYICAMPSSNAEEGSLPRRIVANLKGFGFEDISNDVYWTSKTKRIKNAENPVQKLSILEESGLFISNNLNLKGKKVLLFDDLYMSGVSMQYVAMKLKEAGANRVYGLCVVKSRSNTSR